MKNVPVKTIERLVLYKRVLQNLESQKIFFCFSHELAHLANNSAAQVRRDLMLIGASGGTPGKGYAVSLLIKQISSFLVSEETHHAALIGIGNLGKAILSFFSYRQPNIKIVLAFDTDETKTGRVISGVHCHHTNELYAEIQKREIHLGIITVPALQAQQIANELVDAGVKGILNFAPVSLRVPHDVFVEELDIGMKLEKLACLVANN